MLSIGWSCSAIGSVKNMPGLLLATSGRGVWCFEVTSGEAPGFWNRALPLCRVKVPSPTSSVEGLGPLASLTLRLTSTSKLSTRCVSWVYLPPFLFSILFLTSFSDPSSRGERSAVLRVCWPLECSGRVLLAPLRVLMMKFRWFLPLAVCGLWCFIVRGVLPSLMALCCEGAAIDLDLPSNVTPTRSGLPLVTMWL